MMNTFYVYIMTNRSRTLYTGVTNDLERRVYQHKMKKVAGFASRYNITRLAFYEAFPGIVQAIEREKQIKGWLRIKKIALIEEQNPQWLDLAADWFDGLPSEPTVERRQSGRNEGTGAACKIDEGSFGVPQDDMLASRCSSNNESGAASGQLDLECTEGSVAVRAIEQKSSSQPRHPERSEGTGAAGKTGEGILRGTSG